MQDLHAHSLSRETALSGSWFRIEHQLHAGRAKRKPIRTQQAAKADPVIKVLPHSSIERVDPRVTEVRRRRILACGKQRLVLGPSPL
jgi:hypothetical protein